MKRAIKIRYTKVNDFLVSLIKQIKNKLNIYV